MSTASVYDLQCLLALVIKLLRPEQSMAHAAIVRENSDDFLILLTFWNAVLSFILGYCVIIKQFKPNSGFLS